MKRQNVWIQPIATVILLAGALLGISLAENGRDFAGFYELREVNDLGDQVSGRFAARVFNYSGGDIVGATILLNDSMLGGDPMASWPYQTIFDRESVRVEAWITVPKQEQEQWRQGGNPMLQVEFKDQGGNTFRRPVELVQSPVGEEN
jgi:hypothetical protein